MNTGNHVDSAPRPSIDTLIPTVSMQPLRHVRSVIAKAFVAFVLYRAHRAAHAQLNALNDRMLKDIGLTRSEIDSALLNRGFERRNGTQMPESPNY